MTIQDKTGDYDFQKPFVSILWSAGLRCKIEEGRHIFTGEELLGIANRFARTYAERLHLFALVEENGAPEIARRARACIQWQKKVWELFLAPEENAVYELHIKRTPDAWDERYLCGTYGAALRIISAFYDEYECAENETSRYTIDKRKVLSGEPAETFDEDLLGSCELVPGCVVRSVWMESAAHEHPCDGNCFECTSRCVDMGAIVFPRFLANRELAKIKDYDGAVRYGVVFDCNEEPDRTVYFVPLEACSVCMHDFGDARNSHEHIDAPQIDKASPGELPEYLRERYQAYAAYLEKNQF